jgi:hypothetical protein
MNSVPIELKGKEVSLGLVPSGSIVGDDEEDTVLLRKMFDGAKQYISSFSWCDAVLDSYFGGGVGGSLRSSFSIFAAAVWTSIRGYGS